MERARLSSLLVIALLQLSQTEISNTLPESWYAANVINDGAYTPKPLSEIFSTQPTFSTTNPIVVLSTSQNTPTSTFSTTTDRISTWTTQSPASEVLPLSTEPSPRPVIPISTTVSTTPTTVTTFLVSTQPSTSEPSQPPTLAVFQQPPAPPSPPPVVSTPQQIQINTAPQGSPPPQIQNQPQNLPPNYFLVYQAPQTVQTNPSTSLPPSSTLTSVVTSTSTLSTPMSTLASRNVTAASSNAPCNTTRSQFPSFRIRMVAPAGSVTNVLFNPQAPTTTTRRPTTTRNRRRNRNNYDGCVNGCGGTRVPVCASPLGVRPIDPDSLKGFPSVCHMACHNSFRRNLYEKVMDGKCGRLRNRIQPVNSNNKLKREELNKASYTVVQGGPTVIELSRVDA